MSVTKVDNLVSALLKSCTEGPEHDAGVLLDKMGPAKAQEWVYKMSNYIQAAKDGSVLVRVK